MNPQEHDHPDFTAYALGELTPADAERVRQQLAESPEARAAFARIEQTIGALQSAPSLPKRALDPRQRETVLAMGQAPEARARNVVPFHGFRRPAGSGTSPSLLWRVSKFAAAACLVAGAFMLGQRTASQVTPMVVKQDAPVPESTKANTTEPVAEPNAAPAPVQVAELAAPQPTPAAVAPKVEPAPAVPVVPPATQLVAAAEATQKPAPAADPAPHKAAPAVAAAKPATPPAAPVSLRGFAQASVSPSAELHVRPQLLRPLPVPHEFAGVVLASPLPPDAKPAPAPQKLEGRPALLIHTWKAEIASCPWDAGRRLMRFVAQVPVEQPGIEHSEAEYKLVAKFDPFQVQGFRLVTEKQIRPVGAGTQATCFAWYEIIPTRNFNASPEKPVTIGTISVEQPRGAPSDLAPLPLVDKGIAWSDRSEDFVFETAMIGWNMLLKGTENLSGLNSRLVLDLAEKTRGEDAKGERTKFINVVKQAQRAVGM